MDVLKCLMGNFLNKNIANNLLLQLPKTQKIIIIIIIKKNQKKHTQKSAFKNAIILKLLEGLNLNQNLKHLKLQKLYICAVPVLVCFCICLFFVEFTMKTFPRNERKKK